MSPNIGAHRSISCILQSKNRSVQNSLASRPQAPSGDYSCKTVDILAWLASSCNRRTCKSYGHACVTALAVRFSTRI